MCSHKGSIAVEIILKNQESDGLLILPCVGFQQYNTGYNANPYNPQNQYGVMPGAGRQFDPQYNTGNFNNGLNQPINRQFDPRFNSSPAVMSSFTGLLAMLVACFALY